MEQIKEWKARAAHAWKYYTKAQQEMWDMRTREHNNQQPLIAKRFIQSLQMNASKLYGAVALDIREWCSASTRSHRNHVDEQQTILQQDTAQINPYCQQKLPLIFLTTQNWI
jgi:hypothetical protein